MTHPKSDNAPPTSTEPVLSAEEFTKLQDAAKRLIAVQNEVFGMPQEQQQWFFSKEGHADAFALAWWVNIKLPQLRALLAQRDKRVEELTAVLLEIAKPALGGKQQQWLAQKALGLPGVRDERN